ncbi:hypothetical protein FA15DRAFT_705373 [Coprinopsis marcescibilis]|uniref:Uncharacterized protein n=1 Tax=Coprinopsis marcescibilis TaxID=230819 RepID=A0A5C3KUG2_COPMA|nr:hypothetical protein FA15DRAFT_705373 [Coprinopsis marcescibilis]
MTFNLTAPATIDVLLNQGRIYNINVGSLERRFAVKKGTASSFAGTFYYNDIEDISDKSNQIATTGTWDNRLIVRFSHNAAKFITADQFSEKITEADNAGEWKQWIFIDPKLATQGVWETKSQNVWDFAAPDVPPSLKNKSRWIEGVIRNATDFPIRYVESYLDSGRYDKFPDPTVNPFAVGTFNGCNGDHTLFTGITGGATYRIDLDEDHSFYFSIGFTDPFIGAYKAGVVASNDPEQGYEVASKEGGEIRSGEYHAVDKDGRQLVFRLRITAESGQRPRFCIEEVRFYDN